MDFEAFLINKKIDSALFSKGEPELFSEWKSDFEQMHSKSFEARKLFLINPIRRKYKLQNTASEEKQVKKPVIKPVIKPKIKR